VFFASLILDLFERAKTSLILKIFRHFLMADTTFNLVTVISNFDKGKYLDLALNLN
jgi:hypothetical protein